MPVLSSVIRLVTSVVAADGVRVAVQVVPPSLLLNALSVPLLTVKSALVRPLTASLKVMVTSEVSPAVKSESAKSMLAIGRAVSIA